MDETDEKTTTNGIPKNELARLKAEHPKLLVYDTGGFTFALNRPDRMAYRSYRATSSDRKNGFDAAHEITMRCTVWPARAELSEIIEEYPGLADDIAAELVALARNSDKAEAKKA